MKKILLLILFIGFICTHDGFGQSTLINALPLEYNPSFAGSAGKTRVASTYYLERKKTYDYLTSTSIARISSSSVDFVARTL